MDQDMDYESYDIPCSPGASQDKSKNSSENSDTPEKTGADAIIDKIFSDAFKNFVQGVEVPEWLQAEMENTSRYKDGSAESLEAYKR